MDETKKRAEITDEDLRAALIELKTFIDVTEEDLRKIYEIALRHAKERLAPKIIVLEVMQKTVVSVTKETNIHEAARLLSHHRISGMPVVDEQNRVIGVISEADLLFLSGMNKEHSFKDILHHLLGEPLSSRKKGEMVGNAMSTPVITTGPDQDIRAVAVIMGERRIKRLPVVDKDGKLIGIISRADIVRTMGKK